MKRLIRAGRDRLGGAAHPRAGRAFSRRLPGGGHGGPRLQPGAGRRALPPSPAARAGPGRRGGGRCGGARSCRGPRPEILAGAGGARDARRRGRRRRGALRHRGRRGAPAHHGRDPEPARRVALANKETAGDGGQPDDRGGPRARGRRSCPWIPSTARSSSAWWATTAPRWTGSCSPPRAGRSGACPRPRPGPGHRGGGAQPSDVEDGRQDHGGLRHPHEQGARGHRGALAVRRRARAGAGGRAPAVDRPLHGRVRGRLGHRPARRGRHGHPDPLRASRIPSASPRPAERLDLTRVGPLTFEEPDVERFPCLALARRALARRRAARRSSSTPPTRSRWRRSSTGAFASSRSPS